MTVKTMLPIFLAICLALDAFAQPAGSETTPPPAAPADQPASPPGPQPGTMPSFPAMPTPGSRIRTNLPVRPGPGNFPATPAAPVATPPTVNPAATPPPATVPPVSPLPAMTPPPAAVNPAATPADRIVVNNPPAEDTIPAGTIAWVAADLTQVLDQYAQLTGRTVLRAGNLALPAPIALTTASAMTRSEVIQALDSVLALNNISMIAVGEKFVKAVPSAEVFAGGAPFQPTNAVMPELGPYIQQIVQLQYSKPSEVGQVLALFSKVQNSIVPVDSSQILVLRDYTENVKRMMELIKEIDIAVPSEFVSEVIPIKYAMASDIASALSSLSSGASVTSSGSSGRTTGTGAAGATGTANRLGMGGMQTGQPGTQMGGTQLGQIGNRPTAQPSFTDRLQNIIKKASTPGSGDVEIIGPTKIVADERANSLLVFASRRDMTMITNIVAKLDVILPQVLIEAIIMDVQLGDGYSFGVSYLQKPQQAGSFTGVGGINNLNAYTDPGFGSFTNMTRGFNYFARFGDDLDVVVNASANDSRVNVVQKPRIMTFHAKPASFFIGNTVPYVTSTYYGGGYGYGGGYPSSQYQQLRVGIQLDVTPYINQDGLVVMEISQQIEEISGSTAIANVGDVPNTASRSLSAQVAVKDRETIILGGFIRNSDDKSKSGVPILKDIPLLGFLFNKTAQTHERKELLVLMRPTVLRTPELAAVHTTAEKMRLPGVSEAEAKDKEVEDRTVERTQRRLEKKSGGASTNASPDLTTTAP